MFSPFHLHSSLIKPPTELEADGAKKGPPASEAEHLLEEERFFFCKRAAAAFRLFICLALLLLLLLLMFPDLQDAAPAFIDDFLLRMFLFEVRVPVA